MIARIALGSRAGLANEGRRPALRQHALGRENKTLDTSKTRYVWPVFFADDLDRYTP